MDDYTLTPSTSLTLFKEISLGNAVVSNLTTVQIEVPQTASGASTFTSLGRNSRSRRRVLTSLPTTTFKDEEEYSKNTLVTSSSIYFSEGNKYPRSIQWRILRDRTVLELRSADLNKRDGETREASVVLQLIFPSPLRKGCVALTDAEYSDFINVFVVTKELDLLTFTLARDFFCYAAASEGDIGNWCKVFRPASFHISQPHRLIAEKPEQVVVSLCDGRLLNLTRVSGADGSLWRESAHGQGKWAAMLGGLVRWQGNNTVKYDGESLDAETATSLALSPDGKHVYAVCLNHTFKVWSFERDRSVFATDLAGQERDIQETPKLELDPGALNRIQIFKAVDGLDGEEYYIMTYSPQDLGQFKIWAIRDPNEGAHGVRDLFPEYALRAPDPDPSPESKDIWTVVDFRVTPGGPEGMKIWVLLKSNSQHRLYSLPFSLENLTQIWKGSWSMTASETIDRFRPFDYLDTEPKVVTELWLDVIFSPGRYPATVIATALSMYCSAKRITAKADPKLSFRNRLAAIVTSHVPLHRSDDGGMDLKRHCEDINQEWLIFWQDIRDLNNTRWKVQSLAYDEMGDIPWIVFTDGFAAVRDCSRLEKLAHNSPTADPEDEGEEAKPSIESLSRELDGTYQEPYGPEQLADLAHVVQAAAAFRKAFGCPLKRTYNAILVAELWQDSLYSVPARMASLHERFNFDEEIGVAEAADLDDGLNTRLGGYWGLYTTDFLAIINELPQVMVAEVSGLICTKLGLKVLLDGAFEMINLHERILIDLLVLVVFIHVESEREQTPLPDFDAAKIYLLLLEELRKYQLMQWLGRNVRAQKNNLPEDLGGRILAARENRREKGTHSFQMVFNTVLEDLFVVDVKPQSCTHQSQRTALTHSILDILKWITGGNEPAITLDIVLVHIQCNLLANDNLDLASDFLQYQPSTAWATYIKGRLYLTKGEYEQAALHFKKAAFKICKVYDVQFHSIPLTLPTARPAPNLDYQNASSNLLSAMEAAHLGQDLPTYYSHILTLFDSAKCPPWVASFAHLALQFTPKTDTEQSSNLLASLFHSSLSLADHDAAYTALIQHPDPTSLLPTLISTMLTENKAANLIAFPFPPALHPAIDSYLLQKARSSPIDNNTRQHSPSPSLNYYQILSSWRLRHHNAQGAAAALLERLHRLPDSFSSVMATTTTAVGATTNTNEGVQEQRDAVLETYLAVINLLSCAGEGWVLSGGKERRGSGIMVGGGIGGGGGEKRKVVTLEDVRRSYQEELDRRSVIENGRFGFDDNDGEAMMDVL